MNQFNNIKLKFLKTLLAIIFLVFSFLCSSCGNSEYKEKSISKVINIEYQNITKIIFSDGARGKANMLFSLEDKEKIMEFMKYVNSYVIQKKKNSEPLVGWIHNAQFYNKDKKLMEITFTNPLCIDGVYYDIINGDLSPEKIDEFLRSANPSWDTTQVYIGCNPTNNLVNTEEVESIIITTLPSPPKVKVINKKDDIKKIMTFINSMVLEEIEHDDIKGWVIMITIKTTGKTNHSLSFLGHLIHIDDKWYTTNQDQLSKLRNIYNDLDYKEIPFSEYRNSMYDVITE